MMDMLNLRSVEQGVIIPVKAVPGASRDRFAGEWNGRAKITVVAPPEAGRANRAICALLAELLGVRRADVRIVHGESTPLKEVEVRGVSPQQARASLHSAFRTR